LVTESKIVDLLLSDKRVLLIKNPLLKEDKKAFKESIANLKRQGIIIYDLVPSQVTMSFLLSIWPSDRSDNNLPATVSRFRMVCAGMSRHKSGIIFVHNAHRLDDAAQQLIAQLVMHAEQEKLGWRFFLAADPNIKEFSALSAIGIDGYFPESIEPNSVRDEGQRFERDRGGIRAPRSSTVNEGVEEARSKLGLFAAAGLTVLAIAVGAFFMMKTGVDKPTAFEAGSYGELASETEPSLNTPPREIFSGPDTNSGVQGLDDPKAANRELNNYLQELEGRNKEFEESLSDLKASTVAKPSVNIEPSADSVDKEPSADSVDKEPSVGPGTTSVAKGPSGAISSSANTPGSNRALAGTVNRAQVKSNRPSDSKSARPRFQIDRPVKREALDRPLAPAVVLAITSGDLEISKKLIVDKQNFRGRGKNGESALIMSVVANQPNMVKLLLENNLDTELVDKNGRTALYYASIDGNSLII